MLSSGEKDSEIGDAVPGRGNLATSSGFMASAVADGTPKGVLLLLLEMLPTTDDFEEEVLPPLRPSLPPAPPALPPPACGKVVANGNLW